MVNKQYTIQQPQKDTSPRIPTKLSHFNIGKRYSPPPVRSISLISDVPNPNDESSTESLSERISVSDGPSYDSCCGNENYGKMIDNGNGHHDHHQNFTTFGRNIAMFSEQPTPIERKSLSKKSNGSDEILNLNMANGNYENDDKSEPDHLPLHRFEFKNLTINDIGRFQYILQMDKEMGSHPDTLYRIPSRIPTPTSNSSSLNSSNYLKFWKTDSQSAIASSSASGKRRHRRQTKIYKYFKDFWKYTKWPLLLLLSCLFLSCVIFFVINDVDESSDSLTGFNNNNNGIEFIPSTNFSNSMETESQEGLIGHPVTLIDQNDDGADDDGGRGDNELKENISTNRDQNQNIDQDEAQLRDGILKIFMKIPSKTYDSDFNDWTGLKAKEVEKSTSTESTTVTYAKAKSRNTQILKLMPHTNTHFEDDLLESTTTEKLNNGRVNFGPTKETFKVIGFTSGHQNNFGVPIEEDERILRILNEELIKFEQSISNRTTTIRSSPESTTQKVKVSPTVPAVVGKKSTEKVELTSNATTADVGNCQSTSLEICRGVLQYDLTTFGSQKSLSYTELEHFKYLFDSKCSARAAEFVCSALEPECRPMLMGILQPCKRICKSILEPCASIIASSEILTMTFDCDRYPDSSDRNVCEDPTRRSQCLSNEFKCLDSTCIPHQWKCDNIKDCSLGEDEESCMFCEHEEFRCQTNDKCIPDKYRCDQYDDCPDGSDEHDCFDYEDPNDEDYPSPRIYSFASIQAPDSPNGQSYITISDNEKIDEITERNLFGTTAVTKQNVPNEPDTQTNDTPRDDNEQEIQKGAASGRVIVGIPKSLVNFQDSKEIMMTSDSETDFKYSVAANGTQLATNSTSPPTNSSASNNYATEYQSIPRCPENQLRCVSGKCITVDQLCDKIVDCPDEADEQLCVYQQPKVIEEEKKGKP